MRSSRVPFGAKLSLGILLFCLSWNGTVFAQAGMKEHKAGHIFYISLPDYMKKTYGLNSNASIQFKNTIRDVYGFVIEDTKEVLSMVEMPYGSAQEFYDDFIKDFLADQKNRTL